jgi:hypothetical protein
VINTQQLKKRLIISFRFSIICQALLFIYYLPIEISCHGWPTVEATVVTSDHTYECSPIATAKCTPIAHISYVYSVKSVDNKSHSYTNSINYKAQNTKSLRAQEIAIESYRDRYPVGKTFRIYYNKKAPEQSDIQPFMSVAEWTESITLIFIASMVLRLTKSKEEKYQTIKFDFVIIGFVVTALILLKIITVIIG